MKLRYAMQIKDVMTRDVAGVRPDTPLADAVALMAARGMGLLPVCDGDHLVGMLTDAAVAAWTGAAGSNPQTSQVHDAMTPDVVSCWEDQGVAEAASLMKTTKLSGMLVLSRDGRLAGMVSLRDAIGDVGDTGTPAEMLTGASETTPG